MWLKPWRLTDSLIVNGRSCSFRGFWGIVHGMFSGERVRALACGVSLVMKVLAVLNELLEVTVG